MQRYSQLGLEVASLLLATTSFASQLAILCNGFSIRHEQRSMIGGVTRLYTGSDATSYIDIPTTDIDHFELDIPRAPVPVAPDPLSPNPMTIDQIIGQASDTYKIDSDLINTIIKMESDFNIGAVSPKGAQGLMQLMPGTANDLGITNAWDPKANVDGGTRYLRFLLEKYNFDLVKALAAYNAGPERVDRFHGVPPYYETHAYVARIVRDYNRKKLAESKALKTRTPRATTIAAQARTLQLLQSQLNSTRFANHRGTKPLGGGALAPRAPSPISLRGSGRAAAPSATRNIRAMSHDRELVSFGAIGLH